MKHLSQNSKLIMKMTFGTARHVINMSTFTRIQRQAVNTIWRLLIEYFLVKTNSSTYHKCKMTWQKNRSEISEITKALTFSIFQNLTNAEIISYNKLLSFSEALTVFIAFIKSLILKVVTESIALIRIIIVVHIRPYLKYPKQVNIRYNNLEK